MAWPVLTRAGGSICRQCRTEISRLRPLAQKRFKSAELGRKVDQPPPRIRTRFAPSPTGFLHLGSLRTALFNYLLAKKSKKGRFILRIEDTDQKRIVPGAEQAIYDGLRWAGLHWDEGPIVGGPYGPYRQSERLDIYAAHANQLLESNHAYRCFCSAERLEALASRRSTLGEATVYDQTCSFIPKEESDDRAAKGESFVVRFRAPKESVTWPELMVGNLHTFKTTPNSCRHFADSIILKSDGWPTYHLASVVDDHLMKITHVIRGMEWGISTPRHAALYAAFGWDPPTFAHLGLLMDSKGRKLSKRESGPEVSTLAEFEAQGILPETLNNFVALMGWSHGSDQKSDFFTMDRLKLKFNMKWPRGQPMVDLNRLELLQRKHMAIRVAEGGGPLEKIAASVTKKVREHGFNEQGLQYLLQGTDLQEYVQKVVEANAQNYSNIDNFVTENYYFFQSIEPSREAIAQLLAGLPAQTLDSVRDLQYALEETKEEDWNIENLRIVFTAAIDELAALQQAGEGEKQYKIQYRARIAIFTTFRSVIQDGQHGAPVFMAMVVLGKRISLQRLKEWLLLAEGQVSTLSWSNQRRLVR